MDAQHYRYKNLGVSVRMTGALQTTRRCRTTLFPNKIMNELNGPSSAEHERPTGQSSLQLGYHSLKHLELAENWLYSAGWCARFDS
jgi:hypothetical protein